MNDKKLNTAGYVRLAIYLLSALVGLSAVVVNAIGMGELAQLLGAAAGAVAAITGGTATFNLPKAPDQSKTGGIDLTAAVPAIMDIAMAARAYTNAVEYEPKHAAVENGAGAPTGDMASYAASVRRE